jgi:hypothetical protein
MRGFGGFMSDLRGYLKGVGKRPWWQCGVFVVVGLMVVAGLRRGTKLYVVQEIVVVLGVIALVMAGILVATVGLLLLHEGVRRGMHLAKTGLVWIGLAKLRPQDHG